MKKDLAQALIEYLNCLEEDRATLDEFLVRYPEHVLDLRSLLQLAEQVRRVPHPTPSPAASAAGRRRMLAALAEKMRRQATPPSPFSRFAAWITGLVGTKEQPAARRYAPAFRLALAVVPLILLLVVGSVFLRSWFAADVTQGAHLGQVSGTVDILPAGSDAWQPAGAGTQIEVGDRVRTGPRAIAFGQSRP